MYATSNNVVPFGGLSDRRYLQDIKDNWCYYNGDHFKFWIGPSLPASVPNAAEKMAEIERVFQSANLIEECVNNWRDGLIASPFTWYLKGKNGERTKAPEAELQLQRWLDQVEQMASSEDSDQGDPWSDFVLGLGVSGEGSLRLWQPKRFENDPDPIRRIHLHSPKVGTVAIARDADGFAESISYSYGEGRVEKQYFNESGQLVIEVTNPGAADNEPILLDTDGRWTVQQVKARSLLTPSIKQLQNSINHALTMKLRNQELSGFRERTFLNAQAPGEWVDDPSSPGGQKFIPSSDAIERGPGYDNYVYGIPSGTDINPTVAAPQVHESQPVEVRTYRESIEIDRTLMYLAFKQGHLLSQGGDERLSGESRIQMRQGFESFLRGWKTKVESAIANILNVVLRILGYSELEAVVQLRITTGKLSAEERKALMDEYNAGLLSKATTVAILGSVEDVDAELALMKEEAEEKMKSRPVSQFSAQDPPASQQLPAPAEGDTSATEEVN
jgi:hypothetical protein